MGEKRSQGGGGGGGGNKQKVNRELNPALDPERGAKPPVKQRRHGVTGGGGGASLQQMSGDRKSGEIIENTIKLIKKKI